MSAPDNPLLAALLASSWPVHVVMDGAKYPDLPALLAKLNIGPRSLFVEQSDPAMLRAGPWLATLDQQRCQTLFEIEGIAGAAVFWTGPAEEEQVFRHLRGLNMVNIPRPAEEWLDPLVLEYDLVLFRHYDPSVLALLWPVLDDEQRARIFGPMRGIALHDESTGGAREAKRREGAPDALPRRLKFSASQMAAIIDAMKHRSRLAVAAYLRDVAPKETEGMDSAVLLAFVVRAESGAKLLGMTTERAISQWAYLLLISQGRIAESKEAVAFITAGPGRPDRNADTLLLGIGQELRRRETAS